MLGGEMRNRVLIVAAIFCAVTIGQAGYRSARGIEPRKSGLNEVLVLHPGTNARNLPGVVMHEHGDSLYVDIPPTVHVHRFYYSGDKEFQGPIVEGGPIRVVAKHPKSMKTTYIDVTLPNGAPVIAHCKSSITYIYPDQRISVCFSRWKKDVATVKHRGGRGIVRKVADRKKELVEHTKSTVQNSPTAQAIKEQTREGQQLFAGVKGAFDNSGAKLLDGIRKLSAAIPGVTALKSKADQKPTQDYLNRIRAARSEAETSATRFIPTNR